MMSIAGKVLALLAVGALATQGAELVVENQFGAGIGGLVGAGYDPENGRVWVYGDFDATIASFTSVGVPAGTVPVAGEGANDADIDFTPEAFTLGTTAVPAGTLLFVNGETGGAEVYAINKSTGAVIGSLATGVGTSHVVGVAWHALRKTLFLVADKLDNSPSRIFEINPATGAVLNSFGTGSADYTINYGDIEVSAQSGNIFLVSSDEGAIRELTASGELVRDWTLPAGVSSISGIGLDDAGGRAVLSGTGGTVWIVRGFPARPVLTIRRISETMVDVCWNTIPGRRYRLLGAESLDAGSVWTDQINPITATGPEICANEVIAVGTTALFYRVELLSE